MRQIGFWNRPVKGLFCCVLRIRLIFLIVFLVVHGRGLTASDFQIPHWVSDHMVLPANTSFSINGRAMPGSVIFVQFDTISKEVITDTNGSWTVSFKPIRSSICGDLNFICDSEKRVISDVITGDIWLCAGQSNMQRTVAYSKNPDEAVNEIETADIRYYNGTVWKRVKPENVINVSAVAVYFSLEMTKRTGRPIGIFVAAKGGTGIEAWLPVECFPDTDLGKKMKVLYDDPEVLQAAAEDKKDFRPAGKHRLAKWGLGRATPASLFEQLIRPNSGMEFSGLLWYQGESNTNSLEQAEEYHLWLKNLVAAYRNLFNNKELPVLIVKLPAFDPGSEDGRFAWAMVQKAQSSVAQQSANIAVVDIHDLGDLRDIHPERKKEVGVRSADAALQMRNN